MKDWSKSFWACACCKLSVCWWQSTCYWYHYSVVTKLWGSSKNSLQACFSSIEEKFHLFLSLPCCCSFFCLILFSPFPTETSHFLIHTDGFLDLCFLQWVEICFLVHFSFPFLPLCLSFSVCVCPLFHIHTSLSPFPLSSSIWICTSTSFSA